MLRAGGLNPSSRAKLTTGQVPGKELWKGLADGDAADSAVQGVQIDGHRTEHHLVASATAVAPAVVAADHLAGRVAAAVAPVVRGAMAVLSLCPVVADCGRFRRQIGNGAVEPAALAAPRPLLPDSPDADFAQNLLLGCFPVVAAGRGAALHTHGLLHHIGLGTERAVNLGYQMPLGCLLLLLALTPEELLESEGVPNRLGHPHLVLSVALVLIHAVVDALVVLLGALLGERLAAVLAPRDAEVEEVSRDDVVVAAEILEQLALRELVVAAPVLAGHERHVLDRSVGPRRSGGLGSGLADHFFSFRCEGSVVPGAGFEPAYLFGPGILSPLRLPFRHPG